jgi:drug/metabolite transporter (DMT)-like permease
MPARDLLLALLICVAWAGNFLMSALALREMPPLLFTALRLGLLFVLLAVFLRRPARGQWPRLLGIALCTGVLHFGLRFWALKLAGDLSSPAIVMQSYVPMTVLLAWAVLGERFAWRTGAAIVASALGHGLYYTLVQRHPVATVMPWLMLSPLLAIALGIAFWGDRPGPRLWIGGAMVLGGILVIAWRSQVRVRPAPVGPEEL